MRKIIFVIVIALAVVTFSYYSNNKSVKDIKMGEIIATGIVPEISNNETQTDIEIPNKKLKPIEVTSYIEQTFIDFIKGYLDNNNEYELLKDIVSSRLMTKEEFALIDLGGAQDYIVEQLESDSRYASYHEVMLVDADNDGIDDIVVYLHSGGSAGFVELIFYKGYKNNIFKETYSSSFGIYTENAFVKYNDVNYFLLTSVDYNRKIITGLDLYYFADGVLKESASIQKVPESYTLSEKIVISDEYTRFANELTEQAQEIYFDLNDNEKDNIIGSGETKLSDDENKKANEMRKNLQGNNIVSSWYSSDIDNDGLYEIYSKGVFWPSNNFTYRHLTPDFLKDSQRYNFQKECGLDTWADNRIPQLLWIENVNNKNIFCVLSTKEFNDANIKSKDEFVIDCYYIQKNIYQTVVKLEFFPNYKINIEVYTQDVNKDFIKEGASDSGKG